MPSAIMNHSGSSDELRPHQDELHQLAGLAGIHMDKEVFGSLVRLLNMGVSPDAVFQLLKILKKRGTEARKSRGSHSRNSLPKQKEK